MNEGRRERGKEERQRRVEGREKGREEVESTGKKENGRKGEEKG